MSCQKHLEICTPGQWTPNQGRRPIAQWVHHLALGFCAMGVLHVPGMAKILCLFSFLHCYVDTNHA